MQEFSVYKMFKKNLLSSILLSSMLVLPACGGGSNSSGNGASEPTPVAPIDTGGEEKKTSYYEIKTVTEEHEFVADDEFYKFIVNVTPSVTLHKEESAKDAQVNAYSLSSADEAQILGKHFLVKISISDNVVSGLASIEQENKSDKVIIKLSKDQFLAMDNVGFKIQVCITDMQGKYLKKQDNENACTSFDLNVPTQKNRFVKIAGNKEATYGLTRQGELYLWGMDVHPYEATDHMTKHASPHKIELSNVSDFTVGEQHVCAISEMKLYCWGRNHAGQFGNGSINTEYDYSINHVAADFNNITSLTIFDDNTCFVNDGDLYCSGWKTAWLKCEDNYNYCSNPVKIDLPKLKHIASDYDHQNLCAITKDDKLYCWGYKVEDGNSYNSSQEVPKLIPLDNISKVSVSKYHICAISGKKLYCWGNNAIKATLSDGAGFHYGLLGLGDNGINVYENPTQVGDFGEVSDISATLDHTCMINDKKLYCWGLTVSQYDECITNFAYNAIGLDNTETHWYGVPTLVNVDNTENAYALPQRSFMTNSDGITVGTGINGNGELGNGTYDNSFKFAEKVDLLP